MPKLPILGVRIKTKLAIIVMTIKKKFDGMRKI